MKSLAGAVALLVVSGSYPARIRTWTKRATNTAVAQNAPFQKGRGLEGGGGGIRGTYGQTATVCVVQAGRLAPCGEVGKEGGGGGGGQAGCEPGCKPSKAL